MDLLVRLAEERDERLLEGVGERVHRPLVLVLHVVIARAAKGIARAAKGIARARDRSPRARRDITRARVRIARAR
jgi:hypothetical protein